MGKWERVRLGDVADKISSNIAQKDLEANEGQYPIYGASGLIKFVDFYRHENEYIAVVKDGAGIGRTMMLPAKSSVIGTMQSLIPRKTINAKYLYYAVSSMNLARYYTGATIPHIYFKDYKGELLPLPSLPVQQKIAAVLDKASALIEKRKTQIEKLDLLVKAQFIEMFGDPVMNPKNWIVTQVEDVIKYIEAGWSANGESRVRLDHELAVLKVSAVTAGIFNENEYKVITDSIKKVVYPHKGDLLFSRANTRELVGATCIIYNDHPMLLLPDKLWRILFNSKASYFYMKYILSSKGIRNALSAASTGTSGSMYNISMDKLRKIAIPLPPIDIQNQFSAFVQQVDTQKAVFQKSLEKLELNYKSLMQKCFRGEIFQ